MAVAKWPVRVWYAGPEASFCGRHAASSRASFPPTTGQLPWSIYGTTSEGSTMARQGYRLDDYISELTKEPEDADGFETEGRNLEAALKITRLREARGMTQQQLADRVGTAQQIISRLKSATCRRHPLRTLERIAELLDADLLVTLTPRGGAAQPAQH